MTETLGLFRQEFGEVTGPALGIKHFKQRSEVPEDELQDIHSSTEHKETVFNTADVINIFKEQSCIGIYDFSEQLIPRVQNEK